MMGDLKVREESHTPRSTLKFCAQAQAYLSRAGSSPRVVFGTTSELPHYSTPPPCRPANPFNTRLIESFSAPTCSPDLFSSVVSPSQISDGDFAWTFEDITRIHPAPIDSPQTDTDDHNVCEEVETRVQAAIDRYFEEVHNVFSPPNSVYVCVLQRTPEACSPPHQSPAFAMSTPCKRESRRSSSVTSSMFGMSTSNVDSTSNSDEEEMDSSDSDQANFMQDQDGEGDSINNLSTSTLRRKLFCNDLNSSPSKEVANSASPDLSANVTMQDDFEANFTSAKLTSDSSSPWKSDSDEFSCNKNSFSIKFSSIIHSPDGNVSKPDIASPNLSPIQGTPRKPVLRKMRSCIFFDEDKEEDQRMSWNNTTSKRDSGYSTTYKSDGGHSSTSTGLSFHPVSLTHHPLSQSPVQACK